ncbi:glycosyltransferase [Bifidobacterium sp. SMB2]|uniref:Glycosyltransferase n=1 Tax=Bifidobacterium saimiriisciurei TaxID=2661627 RepID=A0ABX0C8J7_9BIFI|nr:MULTISPECIES: glycosyltransferase [Bifidobacterium]NEG95343.1 glycosyltransferase [Bifidobacterium sp. SMB2]NEH11473.1 glycosyltransferase [Bifidobacterium saimiriisciurei]
MNTGSMTPGIRNDDTPDVSIIIPAYNAEHCIDRCVDSLIGLTDASIEILLVDDGSTDGTPIRCDELAKRDSRIRVIHQRNQGVSAARNTGLQHARGIWIGFVDADDRVDSQAYERVIDAAVRSSDIDLFMFGYRNERIGQLSPTWNMPAGELTVQAAIDMMSAYSGSKGYLWNKLYRRAIIARYGIRCDERILMCEDLLFNIEYVAHCTRIIGLDECAYEYIENASSALHDVNMDNAYTCLAAHEKMLKLVPLESRAAIAASLAIMAEEFLMRTYRTGTARHRDAYRQALRSNWHEAMQRDIPLTLRIRLLAGCFIPKAFYPMWNMVRRTRT